MMSYEAFLFDIPKIKEGLEKYKSRLPSNVDEMYEEFEVLIHHILRCHPRMDELIHLFSNNEGERIDDGGFWGDFHMYVTLYYDGKGYSAPIYTAKIPSAVFGVIRGEVSLEGGELKRVYMPFLQYQPNEPHKPRMKFGDL
ncbi:hypothetical protein [Hirschia maritima]|uniref:hypothetical protein n=1 Tax=Hirschia maritima TaxID=1121961 RepID=UPI00037B22D4|nr:hypothetical protein [Hirschia maritima]